MTPKTLKYADDEIPQEYMAEAIRAYLTDPNYAKTAGHNITARIREFVNSHPELSKIIQFNALIGAPAMGAIYGRRDAD